LSDRLNQTAATSESYRAQTQAADITLTTKEGDRITISQSSMSQQQRAISLGDGNYRLMEQSASANGMSISVQGDLNDTEVADLTSLLNDLGSIATDFFSGNLEDAVNGAMNIGDMGSISKLEATFSQTSLLSNYLSVPHPIPSFAGLQPGPDQNDPFSPPASQTGPSMTDLLSGQWRQFLEALTSQDSDTATGDTSPQWGLKGHHDLASAGDQRQQQSAPPANSAGQAGQQMVDRSKTTMSTNPRLTPLMPSLAQLAINQAKSQFAPGLAADQFANALSSTFTKGFNDWLL
jgi:hypothetical protein